MGKGGDATRTLAREHVCMQRDPPGGTSTFDSQRPSTTYGQSQHP
ncbi:unnamed protein product [Acanthoscelides obtectus]|uniref:Uncharacterized protein n=1 Tax=Acanthoscelides obtectus TaxID=200917 RepID=A0A9P0LUY8_ACAOB|nr:unnamed protein product [Acanthoscelides obtectus]CAK1646595.1 hypothetical protein AOBTE_LOCUS14740 [Acanthoscelides obtectus]